MAKWNGFEERIRGISALLWKSPCTPKEVGGVDIDGFIQTNPDTATLIEITIRRDLAKVREDIQKLVTAKSALFASGVFARCFCIIEGSVTEAMIKAAEPHNIIVLNEQKLRQTFFHFEEYNVARMPRAFGSTVDPITGIPDQSEYVPVKYVDQISGKAFTSTSIATALIEGKHIILTGEYGSGKSRCLREVYLKLSEQSSSSFCFPIAIDLRDSWGLTRSTELISRHFNDLALSGSQDKAIAAFNSGCLTFLLDGFDEIGSQSWSNDVAKLKAIRAKGLEGVKDLVRKSKNGLLITGREHYFLNDEEMFDILGIRSESAILLKCQDEFSEEELERFFELRKVDIAVPKWLPKRPLMCQTIARLSNEEIERMFGVGENEAEFWHHFINVLCEREARIHILFDAKVIRNIYMQLSTITRLKTANVGPITLGDLQRAFELTVGTPPVEEASAMLQRLACLGRLNSESSDRRFVDMYILDGLRACDVSNIIFSDENKIRESLVAKWQNPLDRLGLLVLSDLISEDAEKVIRFLVRCARGENKILSSDIAASLLLCGRSEIDYKGVEISDGHMNYLDMSETLPRNFRLNGCIISNIILPRTPPKDVFLSNCHSTQVYGASGVGGLPSWISNLRADHFDSTESVSRIRKIGLSPVQEILVTIIRKTFFQRGSGRKEESLLRGLSSGASSASAQEILRLLLRENILTRFRGDEGFVYHPQRSNASRMKLMMQELNSSTDPIWLNVREIN